MPIEGQQPLQILVAFFMSSWALRCLGVCAPAAERPVAAPPEGAGEEAVGLAGVLDPLDDDPAEVDEVPDED